MKEKKPDRDSSKTGKRYGLSDTADLRDLGYNLGNFPGKERILGQFTVDDVRSLFSASGIIDLLAARGFTDPLVTATQERGGPSLIRLYNGAEVPENIMIDLKLVRGKFLPGASQDVPYDVIIIEWLLSQNPRADRFAPSRPRLPGQKRPGLNILSSLVDLLHAIGKQIPCDGYLDVPEHFHGAVIYSRNFKFYDPEREAFLRAVMRDLEEYRLADIAWGFITGSVLDSVTGEPMVYEPGEQIYPVSRRMAGHFELPDYRKQFRKRYESLRCRLDRAMMNKRRKEIMARNGATGQE